MVVPANANVNIECATGLVVRLRMKVPGSWWDNNDSSGHQQLHDGKIHSINFEQTKIEFSNYN